MKSASVEFSTITEPLSIDNDEKCFESFYFFFPAVLGRGFAEPSPGLAHPRPAEDRKRPSRRSCQGEGCGPW